MPEDRSGKTTGEGVPVNEAARSKDRGSESNPADSAENDGTPSMVDSDPNTGSRRVTEGDSR